MRTPEQLKGQIRYFAQKHNLMSQEVLQMYLFERVLERLSLSMYKDNFILKGGVLISSILGIYERTTMDMDTTVTGITMKDKEISDAIKNILSIDVGDGIVFNFIKLEPIREDDDYNNFRASFNAIFGKICNPMKLDITTGDKITPAAIDYSYHCIMDDKTIAIKAYNIETIIAEKYETIIRRNISTSRARDFYDLSRIFNLYKDCINQPFLRWAVKNTSIKRGSSKELDEWKDICTEMSEDEALRELWNNYIRTNEYANTLSFEEVIESVEDVGNFINNELHIDNR
ncbi:MAG: nucleotidyl transferase AbiEii/AbiGii toxin family protein [Eubacteriales bacterium]|nr:nucleotidyl transferase AbiEii/AbiGii toxin family protein [Eubacteriales bacterium]